MEKKKRIALIAPFSPYLGGIAHFNDLLSQNLKEEGFEILLIGWKTRFPNFFYPGVQINNRDKHLLKNSSTFLLSYSNPISWFKTSRRIRNFKTDQVILNWVTPFLSPIFACLIILIKLQSQNTKIGFICHNLQPHENRKIDKLLNKLSFHKADFYIVHSNKDRKYLKNIISKNDIRVAYHPTYKALGKKSRSTDYFSQLNLKKGKTILFFGYVRPYKGLQQLLEALPLILKEVDVNLLIAGSFWESEKKYKKLINTLKIQSNTFIINEYIPDFALQNLFDLADVVVLPYRQTSQSGVVQLSFGFKVPVIVNNVGGITEAVKDRITGLIVDPNKTDHLAITIIEYFKNNWKEKLVPNIKKELDNEETSWKKYIQLLLY